MANLFIIAAPSGCGKTSLVKALIEKTQNLCVSVSHTTRVARPGEIHGKNYFFVDKDEFDAINDNDGFIESACVFDNYYGSAKQTVKDLLAADQDVILEIDWQGARQVEKSFPNIISIFIIPPSIEALRERLTGRGQDDAAIIERRMQDAVSEMQHYNEFDYLVINDDFETALDDLSNIIHSQRLDTEQQFSKHQTLLASLTRQ
ncbi:Guanylate kinase [Bathymodiolus thermophilus thioautotrophic gill symbiont]|uniref:Guanylate kinase n=1 Tax=Bathymodiolus thermophilus thioautotrophic gill symbiont TaxID=2360 RepID=A0A1J5TWY7_9GAMM|nr:guanylate kinase [Bathymodiolus thermophilus thioautotrophic gill symbiont]AYQ56722.1 Guanylate kinase [Bathymodiolus thermophilus thioautotrophic gill symbiont]OIR25355.1 guanylate kinase [Bathymodiolus thermophilus thioautotrophic gill symbiont]CAB5495884.1 Guanylate kinase (EC [Bathymodiolus thermophilus thioautotrophic gill symbiont]CAB5502726.1 Guanylate kinase (EC [Bathymodiolus thermophilus thioautotrophic gill symbiont]SGZ85252.1 Guanylate kinase [Bathymodiolus thermophilus thioauto